MINKNTKKKTKQRQLPTRDAKKHRNIIGSSMHKRLFLISRRIFFTLSLSLSLPFSFFLFHFLRVFSEAIYRVAISWMMVTRVRTMRLEKTGAW